MRGSLVALSVPAPLGVVHKFPGLREKYPTYDPPLFSRSIVLFLYVNLSSSFIYLLVLHVMSTPIPASMLCTKSVGACNRKGHDREEISIMILHRDGIPTLQSLFCLLTQLVVHLPVVVIWPRTSSLHHRYNYVLLTYG